MSNPVIAEVSIGGERHAKAIEVRGINTSESGRDIQAGKRSRG